MCGLQLRGGKAGQAELFAQPVGMHVEAAVMLSTRAIEQQRIQQSFAENLAGRLHEQPEQFVLDRCQFQHSAGKTRFAGATGCA